MEPDETVVIDVGTTALEVARALPCRFPRPGAHRSAPAAMELSARSDVESSRRAAGRSGPGTAPARAPTRRPSSGFYAYWAFLGSGGVQHPEAGLTDYYPAEVTVRRDDDFTHR